MPTSISAVWLLDALVTVFFHSPASSLPSVTLALLPFLKLGKLIHISNILHTLSPDVLIDQSFNPSNSLLCATSSKGPARTTPSKVVFLRCIGMMCARACVCNGILCSHKKDKLLPCVTTWMDLEGITLSQLEKGKCQMIPLVCRILKNKTEE